MTWLSSVRTLREAEQVPTLGVCLPGLYPPPQHTPGPAAPQVEGSVWCRQGVV